MAFRYTPNLTGEVAGEWWDPLLNMWTLSWNTTTLLHNPTHLWEAQLLYPNHLSLSYSENLLGETLFYAPIFLLTHNPVLSYNIVFYLTFLLCGTNMYFLARYYTGKPLASFVAALIYAFAPYRLGQIDHIHVIAGEWIPLAFLYLDLSLKQGKWQHWSLFSLFYFLQLLSSIYYGIFLTYTLLAFILIRYARPFVTLQVSLLRRLWRGTREKGNMRGHPTPRQGTAVPCTPAQQLRPFIVQVHNNWRIYFKYVLARAVRPAVVFAIMLIILASLMTPYFLSLSSGLARSINQTEQFSAFVRDFVFASPFNWLYGISSYNGEVLPLDSEHYLFLGLTTMVLAAFGSVLALRRHDPTIRAYLWTGVIVLLFAFGPVLQFSTSTGAPLISGPYNPNAAQSYPPATPMPWLLAYYALPGFKGLRVPARLIGVLLMVLTLLAAYGVAWLQENLRRRTVVRCLLLLIPLALLLEAVPAYLPVTHVPTGNSIPTVYQWLATHGGQEPIVELPMAHLDENFATKDEAWYDYYAIYHPHPIVNGWSGYRPPLTTHIAGVLLNFPSQDSLAILKQHGIRYVVLHLQLYSPDIAPALLGKVEASPELHRVAAFGSDTVWQVT